MTLAVEDETSSSDTFNELRRSILMKTNLFLVESPLQALCAFEASLKCPNDNNVIVCHLSSDSERELNNNQIESIVRYGRWADIEILKPSVRAGGFSVHVGLSRFLRKLSKKYRGSVNRLCLGEFRAKWMHLARIAVEPMSTWLIDDGSESVIAINKYIKNGLFVHDNVSIKTNALKMVVFYLIYGRYQQKLGSLKTIPVNVFSAFVVAEDIGECYVKGNSVKIVRNDFKGIKKIFSVDAQDYGVNEVYYYGSKYSEAGVISLECELEFLENVKSFYLAQGLQVRYFSHRDESKTKLAEVDKIFPQNVERSLEMAETYLLRSASRPREVAGAYSSVLQNLGVIFPEIKITSFKFESKDIYFKFRDDVERTYAHYAQAGIEVVSFQ